MANLGFGQTTFFDNACNTVDLPLTDWTVQIQNSSNNNAYYRLKNTVGTHYVISEAVDLSSYTNVQLTTRAKAVNLGNECVVEYSTNGTGGPWTQLASHTLTGSQANYTDAVSLTNSNVRFRWSCTVGTATSINVTITNLKLEGTSTIKTLNSITYNQASTDDVSPGTDDNKILRIDIDVSGTTGTLNLNSLKITANNSTDADIAGSGVKLYRTTSTTFSTANQLGTAQSLSGGSPTGGTATFSSLNYDLPSGTTYIWAVYDIASSAPSDGSHSVDMQIAANDINIDGSTYPASLEDPTGSRSINILTWTGANSTYWFDDGNWSVSQPTSTDDVYIPSGLTNYPTTNDASLTGKCKDMIIESGATVTMDANTNSFQLYGDLIVNGTFDHTGTKKMLFKGDNCTIKGSGTINSNAKFRVAKDNQICTLERDLDIDRFDLAKDGAVLNINNHTLKTHYAFNNTLSTSISTTINITSGTLEIAGDTATLGATLNAGTGTVKYTGNSYYIYPQTYNNLVIGGSAKHLYGDISVNGTLTNNTTFDANSHKVTLNGSSNQTIDGSVSATFYDLEVNNTNGVTLGNTENISHTLTLTNGVITTTSSNILVFGTSATAVSGGSNTAHIDGPVQKDGTDDFVFPTGKGGKWARIGIANVESGTNSITAEYFNNPYSNVTTVTSPLTKVSQNEYWRLTSDPAASQSANVTLYWEDATWSGIGTPSDLRVAQWAGTAWDNKSGATGGSGGATGSIATPGLVTAHGPFTFGTVDNVNNPLPIELLSFDAQVEGDNVLVNWKTASEQNNDYFIVERSKDGLNAERIGTIEGAGNSNEVLNYEFVDQNPYSGTSYYRLTQVDFNGESETFDWVAVKFDADTELSMIIYPNPLSSGNLNIDSKNIIGEIQIQIFDMSGREVFNLQQNVNSENHTISIPVNLSKGFYNLQLINQSGVITKQLIVN